MATITPQMVKQLRDRTDQPMGLCKQALDQSGGDMDKAIEWLQQQNSKMGVKREANETAEGRIGVFFDNAARAAWAIARPVGYRSSGRLAIIFATTSCTAGGRWLGSGSGSPSSTAFSSWNSESPANGGFPDSIWYSVLPSENMSAR